MISYPKEAFRSLVKRMTFSDAIIRSDRPYYMIASRAGAAESFSCPANWTRFRGKIDAAAMSCEEALYQYVCDGWGRHHRALDGALDGATSAATSVARVELSEYVRPPVPTPPPPPAPASPARQEHIARGQVIPETGREYRR